MSSLQRSGWETGTERDWRLPLKPEKVGDEDVWASGGDNAGEIVAVTRSDARASRTSRREAVVDNDADLLAAAVGEGGVDGDPAHEQLNDLPALGV